MYMLQTVNKIRILKLINEIFHVSQIYFCEFFKRNIALKFYIDFKIVIIDDLRKEAELKLSIFWYIRQRRNFACYQFSNKLIT